MFLYYIHCSDEFSLGSSSDSASRESSTATGNYPDLTLSDDELDELKCEQWQRIKANFSEYATKDRQKILEKATELAESSFVLQHFFDDEYYDFGAILEAALAYERCNLINDIVEGWLYRSQWNKLEEYFLPLDTKLKWKIWFKALWEEKRRFLKIHWHDMSGLGSPSEPPILQRSRRTRQMIANEDTQRLPPPFPNAAVSQDDKRVEVSQYKKERRESEQ